MTANRTFGLIALFTATIAPAQARELLPVRQDPTVHPLPSNFSMKSPSQVTAAIFADLTGILTVGTSSPLPSEPLWWSLLSRRTSAMFGQLAALDQESGKQSFDYDWMCQCRNTMHVTAVPNIIVDSSVPSRPRLTVGIRRYGGSSSTITLFYVNEGGWKIDEIIDDRGIRFTDALKSAARDRLRGATPLPNQLRP